ncbi:hypothetical protein NDU88_008368 [Pleurodeles waltl]|uniref:Uncharacterized protein n=1 Tax=Pleurodeles waltl TaxID=8319 RepID=A0AAV7N4S7_PLEWA|nr:hypothetical protein NDU88_008368 [Pleurodeles waltl]
MGRRREAFSGEVSASEPQAGAPFSASVRLNPGFDLSSRWADPDVSLRGVKGPPIAPTLCGASRHEYDVPYWPVSHWCLLALSAWSAGLPRAHALLARGQWALVVLQGPEGEQEECSHAGTGC